MLMKIDTILRGLLKASFSDHDSVKAVFFVSVIRKFADTNLLLSVFFLFRSFCYISIRVSRKFMT